MFDFDPGSSAAALLTATVSAAYQDMRDCDNLMVVAMTTIAAADGMQLVELVADDNTSFSSPTAVKAHAATVADAVGDYVVLEISDADLQALGEADARYVTFRGTMDDATDEAVITFIAKPNRAYRDLTATTIA
jgi:hypothetical protein